MTDARQGGGVGLGDLALEAAVAADHAAAAVERLGQSLALPGAQAKLSAALAQVQELARRVRAAGGSAGAEAPLVEAELRRLRAHLARFQILLRMLLAHRTALAQFGAAGREAAAVGGLNAAGYGPGAPGAPPPVRVFVEG